MQTTTYVVHQDDVPEIEGVYPEPFDAEKLSIYRDLGRAAGSRTIGFAFERLPPGRRTSFTHAHSDEEELVYVLSGTCQLRVIEPGAEPREIPLRAGHAASFPAGTGIAHTFVNRGTEECTLFIVGERRRGVDRAFYAEDAAYDAHFAKTHPERYWHRRDRPAHLQDRGSPRLRRASACRRSAGACGAPRMARGLNRGWGRSR
jgi:uncharacterized cupin superfamily protein